MDCYILLMVSLTLVVQLSTAFDTITGRRQQCSNEGGMISLREMMLIDTRKCYTCMCKNGYVECVAHCPPLPQDCQIIVSEKCCKVCKGCDYKGSTYLSHTEWTDPDDSCKIIRCESGIITESNMHCHTPCANPLPPEPGKCCPTCADCLINGQKAAEDREVVPDSDPCLKCRCSKGRLVCVKKACPVLQCSPASQRNIPGECCPRCTTPRAMMNVPDKCTLQRSFLSNGNQSDLDVCTRCECINGTTVCARKTCPILDCTIENQKTFPNSCCPICIKRFETAEVISGCYSGGQEYEDGQFWSLDACSSCKCHYGKVSCVRTKCNTTCASGMKQVLLDGECCPKCIEDDGACLAFGDPHYKSFDGKIYTFKGIGKYQLTKDCHGNTFSVKVANTLVDKSTITKRVAINFGDTRLNLQQRGRVKYNGQRITLPLKKEGVFRVKKDRDNLVEVVFQNGMKILWNGRSFLEVTVPASYKNKLCGLCGNFNGNGQDDFKMKSGRIAADKELLNFGLSWCIGNKTECAKSVKHNSGGCMKGKVISNPCKLLETSTFAACESKLNFNRYYKACKIDMCHCPNKRCYCDSLTAYARECDRLGVKLTNWQNETGCNITGLKSRHEPKRKRMKNRAISLPPNVLLSYQIHDYPQLKKKSHRRPIPLREKN